jgi:hypothetical protein
VREVCAGGEDILLSEGDGRIASGENARTRTLVFSLPKAIRITCLSVLRIILLVLCFSCI